MALTQLEVDLANQSLGKIGSKQMTLAVQDSVWGVQANLHFGQTRNMLLRSHLWPFARVRLALVRAWVTDTVYNTDQYVWQEGLLYKCIVAHTSDVFATDLTSADWVLTSDVDAWVTATAYIVGDLITINALQYKCLIAHTSGVFATDLANGDWIVTVQKPENVFGFSYDMPATSQRLMEFVETNSWVALSNETWRLESNTILTNVDEVDIVYIDTITATTSWDSMFTEMFILQLAINLTGPLAGVGGSGRGLKELLLKEMQILKKQARAIARNEGRGDDRKVTWLNARFVQGSGRLTRQDRVIG